MRAWIVAGLGLVLVGFALTLAFDLFHAEPAVEDVDARPTPMRAEVESAREVALERDAQGSTPDGRGGGPPSRTRDGENPAGPRPNANGPREAVHRHPDGSVRDRVALDESGRQQGAYTSFYPDGSPRENGSYERGQKQGTWRSFHENGALREETTWEAGMQRGILRQWDQGGHLVREAHMDGQLEGLCTTWYAGGQLESRGPYASGRREGRWDFWLPSGELDSARSGRYMADQRTGD